MRRRARCGTTRWRTGARSRATTTPSSTASIVLDCDGARAADHLGHRPEPGGRHLRPRARSGRRRRSGPQGGDRKRARLHGTCSPAWRSPACRSTACSSAPAPTPACPICRPPPTWCAGAVSPTAWSRWWCRARPTVKREAEAAGLDRVFRDAGFFWGESGCSMCAGGNGDRGEPGERIVSTTNRNFENRQGPKVRTHLVSPATAAATAIAGRIADVRQLPAGAPDAAVHHPHRHRRAAPARRHQHRPDRAGAGDARAQAGLQEAAVHARALRDDGSEIRTSCSTSRSSAIPASW